MADNLIQKRGESTWYCRLAVPVDVRAAMGGKTVLIRSLQTGLRSEAMERRLAVLAEWKAQIAQTRGKRAARGDTWKEPIANVAHGFAQATRKLKTDVALGEAEKPSTFDTEEVAALYRGLFDDSPEGKQRREKADRVYAMTGVDGELANIDFATEMAQQLMAKVFGVTQQLSPIEEAEARQIFAKPDAHKPRSPITPARLKAYREFRESRGGAPKHVDQQVGKMDRLSTFLKEEELPLTFDTVDKWLKSLDRAPATLAQYLMAGTSFWKWATKYDAGWRREFQDKANPFMAHELPQGGGSEIAGLDREIYTPEDACKLHRAALENDDKPLADLIAMGWYTGARIEELCRLTKESVITVEGIRCFDFPKSKSKASKRVVPIHPNLLPIIDRLSAASLDGFLIPTDSQDRYGKRSHAISKAFGRLRTNAGFSRLYVFHGFRHTVVTALIRADVSDALAKELVGHEVGNVTHDTYSKGASTAQKFVAIKKLPTIPSH
ncbi:site-specific integrase [Pseudomonas veronii]|uniref:site-specific integrase n=1 Tax=Pseudomonas TaxID=286 RepID=UPI000F8171AC|nr:MULTISPECIES: site-specific integrase [Pseudomonas]MDY7554715.1 site-specific integrase [Pseudomonas sp. FG1]MEB0051474.1 site-specific integrase [Pseudomonas sp. FG1]RTY68676.1 site-specific integrase [Pseudomonas veronii]